MRMVTKEVSTMRGFPALALSSIVRAFADDEKLINPFPRNISWAFCPVIES